MGRETREVATGRAGAAREAGADCVAGVARAAGVAAAVRCLHFGSDSAAVRGPRADGGLASAHALHADGVPELAHGSHADGGLAFAHAPHADGVTAPVHGPHADAELHHHHTHAVASRHEGGHHLLQVEGLGVAFDMYDPSAPFWRAGRVRSEALHDLSLSVHAGELLAVVGASGSGKTVLADALMGMFEPNAEVRGRIWFDGEPCDAARLARLRGREVCLVPQGVTSLDPLMRVGAQVRGVARGATRAERRADAGRRVARQRELFSAYGLAPEVERLYPHQLSGGMARRVLLMCALMERPRLIIADEPTPGLDLDLAVRALDDLRRFADEGGGVLLITHDLELALRVADRVAVFKDGTVVEETAVASFAAPELLRHPFSRALWHAMPGHDFAAAGPWGDGAASAASGAGAGTVSGGEAGERAPVADAAGGAAAGPECDGDVAREACDES